MLRLVSVDGDQGFPGTLTVTATYSLSGEDELCVEYLATTDRTTIVSLSNHAYWNLAGEGSAEGALTISTIPATLSPTVPRDPTGELRPVDGTPFAIPPPRRSPIRRDAADSSFARPRYDHKWCRRAIPEPRLLRARDPESDGCWRCFRTSPAPFYSGNFLDATSSGKAGRLYRMGDAIVLEPQMFPDTPNRPDFGSLRIEPGETYHNLIVWRFSTNG